MTYIDYLTCSACGAEYAYADFDHVCNEQTRPITPEVPEGER